MLLVTRVSCRHYSCARAQLLALIDVDSFNHQLSSNVNHFHDDLLVFMSTALLVLKRLLVQRASLFALLVAVTCRQSTRAPTPKSLSSLAASHTPLPLAEPSALLRPSHCVCVCVRHDACLQAGALRTLAADNPDNKEAIRKLMGVPPLVRTLGYGATSLAAQQAAGALANLASNTIANQDAIREAGGIAPLVALARGGTKAQKEDAAAALSNLAANNADNKVAIAQAGGIERRGDASPILCSGDADRGAVGVPMMAPAP